MSYEIRNWLTSESKTFATLEEADAYCDERFLEKPPRPMPKYEPLMVVPTASRKKPGQLIAFIGKQLCFFETQMQDPRSKERFDVPMPIIDVPVEVMITRPLYHKKDNGYDFTRVMALLLCPVEPHFALIEHDGFQCSGSMCATTAHMVNPGGRQPWLTPGRCQIFEASNVNAGSTWKVPYTAKRPGKVWVHRPALEAGHFPLRAEGLARIEDAMYYKAVRQ